MVGSGDACEDGNTDYMFSAPCEPDVKECVSETFKGSGDGNNKILKKLKLINVNRINLILQLKM